MKTEITERLKKHPFLNKYVEHFIKSNGKSEKSGWLPFLTIWFRELFKACEIYDEDVPELLGWDEETSEDFWSWGHNSRYNHVFWSWLNDDIENAVSSAFEIMDHYNHSDFDYDIESTIKTEEN